MTCLYIINTFIALECLLLLLINRNMQKKQKLMEVNNLEKAKKLCAELEYLKIKHYEMGQFPADRVSAKIIITSGEKEMKIPIDVQPLTASELIFLAINRMEVKMEKLQKEIEAL